MLKNLIVSSFKRETLPMLLTVFLAVALSSCCTTTKTSVEQTVSQEIRDIIAVCNRGFTSATFEEVAAGLQSFGGYYSLQTKVSFGPVEAGSSEWTDYVTCAQEQQLSGYLLTGNSSSLSQLQAASLLAARDGLRLRQYLESHPEVILALGRRDNNENVWALLSKIQRAMALNASQFNADYCPNNVSSDSHGFLKFSFATELGFYSTYGILRSDPTIQGGPNQFFGSFPPIQGTNIREYYKYCTNQGDVNWPSIKEKATEHLQVIDQIEVLLNQIILDSSSGGRPLSSLLSDHFRQRNRIFEQISQLEEPETKEDFGALLMIALNYEVLVYELQNMQRLVRQAASCLKLQSNGFDLPAVCA